VACECFHITFEVCAIISCSRSFQWCKNRCNLIDGSNSTASAVSAHYIHPDDLDLAASMLHLASR
jgi:hypothetical protein